MPSAIILIADGTEEIEFTTPYDVLVRAEFEVQSVGVNLKQSYATCSRGVKIIPDTTTLPTKVTADILILPGGVGGAQTFSTHSGVQSLLRAYRDAGKYVGAICAGTLALVASVQGAGKTEGLESSKKVKVTSHPSVKDQIVEAGWEYGKDSERVVVDGKIITSRGPGTALTFILMIVEILAGKEKRNEVKGPMIVAPTL